MAIGYSVAVRNAKLDVLETVVGTSPKLNFFSGSKPANCSVDASGTLLCQISLPVDWMADAASGSKAKLGTWSANSTTAGTIGYFRIYDSSNATCHMQGTVANSSADLTLTNNVVSNNQTITVSTFTLNSGNAT